VTSDEGARHASRPTRLITGEQTFALTLIQHDPEGEPELLIESPITADPDGLHLLTLPEIKTLAETLLIHYLTAAPSITLTARSAGPPCRPAHTGSHDEHSPRSRVQGRIRRMIGALMTRCGGWWGCPARLAAGCRPVPRPRTGDTVW
jgi:hypothetical protein